jgi:phage baseplate assembly protein W
MPQTNLPPPINDAQIVKSLAFPYQLGQTGFPSLANYKQVVYNSIVALLLTGTNERLMHVNMGVNTHQYLFEDWTPILSARLATEVTAAIAEHEPRANVLSVLPEEVKNDEGNRTALAINVLYSVAGQPVSQQVLIPVTTQGP